MNHSTAIDILENCRFCLMCRHVAPVGHITQQEAYTPHGMALVATSTRRGLIDWNPKTAALMFGEVDGGNSRAHCVTDQPFEEAIAAIRRQLIIDGQAPESVVTLADIWRSGRSPFGEVPPPEPNSTNEFGVFVGDEAHFLRPQMVTAVFKLLGAMGIRPAKVGVGQSSGLMAASVGLTDIGRSQLNGIIDQVQQLEVAQLLVLSAADRYAFTQAAADRLELQWPEDTAVVDLAARLWEHIQPPGRLTFQPSEELPPFAYIDPTHAVRLPDRWDIPRKILETVIGRPPLELFWRRDRAHPAGSTFLQFVRPDLAEKLTRARLEDARSSGAHLIFCEDPATLAQLEKFASEYGLGVISLYEWLAECLTSVP